ncbi:uncharacterized protein [Montipora capricornis]|uniref:uncharacterized protein n=1 Tax=Montipora capricornis TaxID=246305 RepID=UPI0035F1B8E7
MLAKSWAGPDSRKEGSEYQSSGASKAVRGYPRPWLSGSKSTEKSIGDKDNMRTRAKTDQHDDQQTFTCEKKKTKKTKNKVRTVRSRKQNARQAAEKHWRQVQALPLNKRPTREDEHGFNKADELQDEGTKLLESACNIVEHDCDIIAVTETWLPCEDLLAKQIIGDVCPEGYKMIIYLVALVIVGVTSSPHLGCPKGQSYAQQCMVPPCDIARSHGVTFHAYADDCQLYITFSRENVSMTKYKMETLLAEIKQWISTNMLKLNDSKTEIMAVGGPRRNLIELQSLTVGNEEVDVTKVITGKLSVKKSEVGGIYSASEADDDFESASQVGSRTGLNRPPVWPSGFDSESDSSPRKGSHMWQSPSRTPVKGKHMFRGGSFSDDHRDSSRPPTASSSRSDLVYSESQQNAWKFDGYSSENDTEANYDGVASPEFGGSRPWQRTQLESGSETDWDPRPGRPTQGFNRYYSGEESDSA